MKTLKANPSINNAVKYEKKIKKERNYKAKNEALAWIQWVHYFPSLAIITHYTPNSQFQFPVATSFLQSGV